MRILIATALLLASPLALASPAPQQATTPSPQASVATTGNGKVVVSGTVPDRATEAVVMQKLHALYGADQVVDNLQVGGVVAPANWDRYVKAMVSPDFKQLSHGKIAVHGNTVTVTGKVPNEATRQKLLSDLANTFDQHYAIKQNLQVAPSGQSVLDQTLANRTIEFKSGSAVLTPGGAAILDQMAAAIQKLDNPFILVVGNTDNVGNASANLLLSIERAKAVRSYLIGKGIPASDLSASGQGEDDPIASNDTAAGRARNRRIEFKIMKQ